MRPATVLQIGDHRTVSMKRGAQARSDGQGQDARSLSVSDAKDSLCLSHGIGVVEHGESALVKTFEVSFDIGPCPSLAQIGGRHGTVVFDRTWEPQTDRTLPPDGINRSLKCRKHGLGIG